MTDNHGQSISFPTAATDTSPVNYFVQSYHHQESHESTDTQPNPEQKCFHQFKGSIQVTDSLCSLPAKPLVREVSQQALMARSNAGNKEGHGMLLLGVHPQGTESCSILALTSPLLETQSRARLSPRFGHFCLDINVVLFLFIQRHSEFKSCQ